jgi:TolB-like protein
MRASIDFAAENMSISDSRLIVDRMFHYLVSQRKFKVVDKKSRDEVLGEIEFSQSNCVDEACQLQIGKLLSIDFIIVGSIGRLSTRYIINAKMLRVETSEAVAT